MNPSQSPLWQMKILTLGPAGTFSHEATGSLFPDAEIEFASNFDDLFDQLEKSSGLGVVPIENSLHGPVDEVFDYLWRTDVKIWKTHDVRIRHSIGAKDPMNVKRIASHPQAIAQCQRYLRKHFPKAEHFPVSSTVYAVELALKDSETAAIASASTMQEQGLPILAEDIEGRNNRTRFAVVAKEDPFPENGRSQMSVVLKPTVDRPGLLHDMLTPFKVYDLNLTRIDSRPEGTEFGNYIFFVDFMGTRENARVQKAMGELKEIAEVKILGEW